MQCSKLKKNPGCPYFKSRATKPVNLVALMNPWLPVRKTYTFKCTTQKNIHFCLLSALNYMLRSLVFPCLLRFSFSLFFLVPCICLAQFSFFFWEAALHQSKNATFALCERKYLYSVLLIEDIKNQNRNKEFENNYDNDPTFIYTPCRA